MNNTCILNKYKNTYFVYEYISKKEWGYENQRRYILTKLCKKEFVLYGKRLLEYLRVVKMVG